jgi:group I intron endonuclease
LYGPGLAISDFNLGILYMLAVSSLATYGILLAGFYYLKSPSFVRTNDYKPIEFQEKLIISQLEAKHALFVNSLKYGRSTTRRLLKKLIVLPRVIGVLNSFLIVPFLRTIYIWYNLAWLEFYYLLFICFALTLGLVWIYGCIVLSIFFNFALLLLRSSSINKSSNKVSFCNTRSKLSGVKLSTTFLNFTGTAFSNSFRRFYSTKKSCSVYPLKNDELNLDQENIDNSNKDLNVEDLKALHSLYTKDLFKDRIAPVVPFDSNLILVSCNLSDDKERSELLKEWGSKGGIYIIEYIHNPLIYYIGRTTLFKRRINNHIKAETHSKFHAFLKLVGLEHFKFSIIEISSPSEQGIRENYYLQKFLPILNTTFSSSFSESAIYTSLTEKITSLKSTTLTQKSNQPIPIYTYTLCKDKGIIPTYVKYNSISEASKMERIAYGTVLLFRDTNVPFRGKLYFTKPIIDFNSTLDKVNNILKDVKLISKIAQKVWVYDAKTLDLITGSPFQSKHQASNILDISRSVINYFIDTKKPEGIKGTYLFSRPLEESEIKSLRELSEDIRTGNKVKVWAYDALTLDLINNEPFSSISDAADYFNVNYRTVNRHLDTKLATKQNKMSVYFFKKEINSNLKMELMKHVDKFHYARSEIWAYKLDEQGKLKLLPDQPFKTKREAIRELHMHNTVINKYIDTGLEYKGLLLYSTSQNHDN